MGGLFFGLIAGFFRSCPGCCPADPIGGGCLGFTAQGPRIPQNGPNKNPGVDMSPGFDLVRSGPTVRGSGACY
jgi:hypothetical protein